MGTPSDDVIADVLEHLAGPLLVESGMAPPVPPPHNRCDLRARPYPSTTDILRDVTNEGTAKRARQLIDQIMRDARADDYRALLVIDADPETAMLLGLLPERATRGANLHLQGARIWRDRQNDKAQDKLDAVKTALDGLDISLAKGLLRRIDSSFLGDLELARFDELWLATEARAVELEDIQSRVPSSSPDKKQKRRGRFRKR